MTAEPPEAQTIRRYILGDPKFRSKHVRNEILAALDVLLTRLDRKQSLEAPAVAGAGEVVCECGHPRVLHRDGLWHGCGATITVTRKSGFDSVQCPCTKFVLPSLATAERSHLDSSAEAELAQAHARNEQLEQELAQADVEIREALQRESAAAPSLCPVTKPEPPDSELGRAQYEAGERDESLEAFRAVVAERDAALAKIKRFDQDAETDDWLSHRHSEEFKRAEKAEAERDALRAALTELDSRVTEDFALHPDEPLGMVSKPHICWATDALSIAGHIARRVLAGEAAPSKTAPGGGTAASGTAAAGPCPHGRPSWNMCPHCLGVNGL